MNRVLFLLILFTLLSSCENTKEVVEQKYSDGSPKVVSTYKNDRILKQEKYYANGQMEITGNFDSSGKREGHWTYWYDNGIIWSECDYKSGIKNGMNTVYYENGKKRFSGTYKDDKKVGKWSFWDESGKIITEKEM